MSASGPYGHCWPLPERRFLPVQYGGLTAPGARTTGEKIMIRPTLLCMIVLLSGVDRLAAQEKVEVRGVTSEVKIEEITFGHLTELNNKFKMRATEFVLAPGAFIGAHHHAGPGIRYILSGEITITEGGIVTVYKAGDYETGNIAHTAENKANVPLRFTVVEMIPRTWSGPAVIPPRSQ